MIEFYPNKISDTAPLGIWKTDRRMTIEAWLKEQAPSYERRESPPISVALNDEIIEQPDWHKVSFKPSDLLQIYREPKGLDEIYIHSMILMKGAKAILKAIMPKMPGAPSNAGTSQGKPLNEASAKGNQVKLGDVIRQIAGYQRTYPSYLCQPRRRFLAPRDQRVEMLLYVGEGRYEIPVNKIKVGETPLIALGDDARFTIYQPGQDLSADPAHINWFNAPEVGASSSGSAGLELTVSTALTLSASAAAYQFSGNTVSIPSGSGTFPGDWVAGLIIRIVAPYQYEVIDGGAGRDVVRGPLAQVAPFAGMAIEVAGTNSGFYTVHSYTPEAGGDPAEITLDYEGGSPVVGLSPGVGQASIGPRGLRYRIVGIGTSVMTVERLTSEGAEDEDWPGFDLMQSVVATISIDPSNLEGGYRGPFACCPENEKITEIEYSVFFANGLAGIGREGQIYQIPATHIFEYRDMDIAGAWTVSTVTHEGGSLDAQGFTNRIVLPYPMRAEARIKRVPSASEEYRDDTTWYDLRGLMRGSPTSYPGLTVMSVDIRGGDRLSAQSESQVSAEATCILPIYSNGSWLPAAPTRDIVPWCLYQLKQRGYTDDDFDLQEWTAFHNKCVARGDVYDETLDAAITVKEMVNNALACGFAELVVFNGLLRPARDELKPIFDAIQYGPKTQTYSPQNMTKALKISGSMPSINDYDGVDVEYYSTTTWAWETVECRWPGDAGTKIEKVKLGGVGDETRAWRIGMRRRGHQIHRTDTYTWETELDGKNSGYLTFAAVADDLPKRCKSSILLSFSVTSGGTLLRSSEPLDFSAGGEHWIGVRRLDGTLSGPFPATFVDKYTARVDALDFDPVVDGPLEPPHILFGPSDKWAYPTLITSADPANGNVSMKGMPYDDRVYTYDDQFPPA
ncbi:host specificity factor TipJ family phage tail protein [Pseudomonas huaxiensis]|uniref:host specificity factor TipJ family phage tail protein n=1 Tax=Pseudomonas huaxiensis TaxID=2213017 RepID=UPI000DA67704|nr:host specificity factor TipJ family phage tail protein [Pseudomonas huaxiensis]